MKKPTNITPYFELKRNIVFKHLDKFRGIPSNTIAKILRRDYPEYFATSEDARHVIRRYRGTNGEQSRNDIKFRKYYEKT